MLKKGWLTLQEKTFSVIYLSVYQVEAQTLLSGTGRSAEVKWDEWGERRRVKGARQIK